jgi:hypothetical protein
MAFGFPDGHVELWDLRSQQRIWSVTNRAVAVTLLASSTTAAQIAVAYKDGLIELLQLETGNRGRSFQAAPDPIVAFSGNGKRLLASAGFSSELSVWNTDNGQLNRIRLKQREGLISAAFSDDGHWVVTTSYDAFASLWQVDSGREIARFTGQFTGFTAAAISPDKTRVALTSNSSDEVSVWDPITEQKLVSFPGGYGPRGFVSGWDPHSDELVALFGPGICRWHAPSLAEIEATQQGQALSIAEWQCPQDKWLRWAAEQGELGAQLRLAWIYHSGEGVAKDLAESRKWHYKGAESGDPEALNNLAWFLATSTDSSLRDGRRAVGFAEQAVAKTERKDWSFLDTLAAAYAEAGDFAKAINAQNEAIALVGDGKIRNDLEARLRLYQSNSPFRE